MTDSPERAAYKESWRRKRRAAGCQPPMTEEQRERKQQLDRDRYDWKCGYLHYLNWCKREEIPNGHV